MAIRVYRVAVVGCPRAVISPDGFYEGTGKSCLCNRFVRPEAYTEDHQQDWSEISEKEWRDNAVFNGDHFLYWGAANKHLPDKSRVRFQVVEQTEFYKAQPVAAEESDNENGNSNANKPNGTTSAGCEHKLNALPTNENYITRASSTHFQSSKGGKKAYRLKAMEAAVRKTSGPVRAATQLFSNEDFGGKKNTGVYGYICVFDPTLVGDQMQKQLNFLRELLPLLVKTKRKVVIACVKCDAVEDSKIRFGAELSGYALKKTIPFFEVSARDSVNVDDVFFSLASAPKKNKRNSCNYISYREVVDSRKGDLNRAKDTFRKFLQQNITDFSTRWNEILPFLKADRSYQAVQELAGSEADEVILKMFRLRLIEIKLLEADKECGHSLAKKADKEQSKKYQFYLKEAFNGHPDLKTDSYRDYLGESDELDSTVLTEPSTPSTSSYCQTPDVNNVHEHFTRVRASTFSEIPKHSLPSADTLQTNKSVDGIDTLSSSNTATMKEKKTFTLPATSAPNKDPPPLPSRGGVSPGISNVLKKKLSRDASPREKRLSSSMDCLFIEDENNSEMIDMSASYNRLDVAPYLKPMEVKKVMAHSLSKSPKNTEKKDSIFLSMRLPKNYPKVRPQISEDILLSSLEEKSKKTNSLDRRTHKRSQSNPFILESMKDVNPPQLPPRNVESASQTPSQNTPCHKVAKQDLLSPVESSLEFTSPTSLDTIHRLSDMPLPPLPSESNSPNHPRISVHPMDKDNNDGDNLSQISGPFEEIDDVGRKKHLGYRSSSSLPDIVGPSSLLFGEGISPLNVEDSNESEEDDQYAQIEDFQEYMKMSSAPIHMSKTIPHPDSSQTKSDDSSGTPVRKSHTLSSSTTLPSLTYQKRTLRKETFSTSPGPIISTLKKLKKSTITSKDPKEALPPLPPHHKTSSGTLFSSLDRSSTLPKLSPSHIHDNRPLPPSPTKYLPGMSITRKNSSGSNIYEVIDEDFVNRVRGKPGRQRSYREIMAKWLPPVDQSLWPKYLEVVQEFFDLPQIQEQWSDIVKSVMSNIDINPDEILPPYSKLSAEECLSLVKMKEDIEEEEEEGAEEKEEEEEGEKEEAAGRITSLSAKDERRVKIDNSSSGPKPPTKGVRDVHPHLHPTQPTSLNSSSQKFPALERVLIEQSSSLYPSSPAKSPQRSLQQSSDSNELILMMNQSNYDISSESDSDDEFDSDSSDSDDFDFDQVQLTISSQTSHEPPENILPVNTKQPPPEVKEKPKVKPKTKPKPLRVSLPQTDILKLRASESNDSDLVSTDSALTKSPHSNTNSAGEFEVELSPLSECEGVEVVHCVKPSQIKRKSSKQEESRIRIDSGNFEDDATLSVNGNQE